MLWRRNRGIDATVVLSIYLQRVFIIHEQRFQLPTTTNNYLRIHDDVIKWKHFPRYWPFVRGIHQWLVDFPHKVQWRRGLMFSLIYAWTYGWAINRNAGDFRRHRARYETTVMENDVSINISSPKINLGQQGLSHVMSLNVWSTLCLGIPWHMSVMYEENVNDQCNWSKAQMINQETWRVEVCDMESLGSSNHSSFTGFTYKIIGIRSSVFDPYNVRKYTVKHLI